MDSSGSIHRFYDEEERLKIEEERGELVELDEDTAQKLEELPVEIRKAFYQSIKKTKSPRDGSFTRAKVNKDATKKKRKAARASRKKNR